VTGLDGAAPLEQEWTQVFAHNAATQPRQRLAATQLQPAARVYAFSPRIALPIFVRFD
jgi:hypothetical protein